MISNRFVPANTLLAHLTHRDVEEAITWLESSFGFVEHYRYGDPVSGAQMSIGNAWPMPKRTKDQRAIPKLAGFQTQCLTVFIEEIAAHFELTVLAPRLWAPFGNW
jgi:hypothetical protein